MKNRITGCGLLLTILLLSFCATAQGVNSKDLFKNSKPEVMNGFVDLLWSEQAGRLYLRVTSLDTPFIYQTSLPRGVGSNDLGLDRGQLGDTKVVRFVRVGPRILMVEDNLAYRALTDNADEKQAVAESFAQSVIWGFDIVDESRAGLVVDATDFAMRDANNLTARLKAAGEGDYKVDASRSAMYLPHTKAFPDNSEIEVTLTYTGTPAGQFLPTVVPDASFVTVHSHHSFVRLPEDGYQPLPYDPRAGVIGLQYSGLGFANYAAPIGDPLMVNYGRRYRLKKKDPGAAMSEAVKPIVFYVDRGAPEPIASALIEGASWWNQAFEAAGFKNAFQVKRLPAGADPEDVRYNIIEWVHRSTRGWSYGSSVVDPRTGELIKGMVTLGSLRVRQDYLIAQGLLAPYSGEDHDDAMLKMSLARIRQLAAHEVGHTIGLEHNFAASTQNRASVMDYPFPLIKFDKNGDLDLSDAYATGIGDWDKRAVMYAYEDFPDGTNVNAARQAILAKTIADGYKYISDDDSRSVSTAEPDGNLWDNGDDAIVELTHLLKVRNYALARFSENNIRTGQPLATLEETLLPLYLLHRYQLIAVGKLVGGSDFRYAMRGDGQTPITPVDRQRQQDAIAALVATLSPDVLQLPANILKLIPPRPEGFAKTRETFSGKTGVTFDSLAPAATAASLTLDVLCDPARAARMMRSGAPDYQAVLDALMESTWHSETRAAQAGAIQRQTSRLFLDRLILLAADKDADSDVRALAVDSLDRLDTWLAHQAPSTTIWRAHYELARQHIAQWHKDPASIAPLEPVVEPPGSPIGTSVGAAINLDSARW